MSLYFLQYMPCAQAREPSVIPKYRIPDTVIPNTEYRNTPVGADAIMRDVGIPGVLIRGLSMGASSHNRGWG